MVKQALLDSTGIEEPLFQSIIRDQCRIEHQSIVRKLSRAAKKALPSRFAKEVEEYISSVKEKCRTNLSSTPPHLFFQLTKDNETEVILNYDESVPSPVFLHLSPVTNPSSSQNRGSPK